MNENHALIVREEEKVSFWERFLFYGLKRRKELERETVSVQEMCFHFIFVPKPKNERQKKYLAQVINESAVLLQTKYVYYPKNGSFSRENENYLSCAIQVLGREIFKKYAKMNQVVLSRASVLLLCDTPSGAEAFFKQIYREIAQPEIYCENASEFSELVKQFSEEYGIFLRMRETTSGLEKKNVLVLSVSERKDLIERYQKERFLPILNLASVRFGASDMYEEAVFSAKKEMNVLAHSCGGFDSSVLFFLGKCFGALQNETKRKQFVEKNQIKCIKLLKND